MKIESPQSYQNEIITAVRNESDIVFVSYSALEKTEEKIKFALAKILEKHNRIDLFTPIYSCIKELISNATKANAKKILMEEGVIKNPDDTEEVVRKVRSILNEKSLLEYGIKAKQHKMSTRIYLKVFKKHLFIEVINNIPMTKKDMAKVNDRIKKSSRYDNIAEYFMDNPDPEAEGMGLGLSMVVVLLKNINITHRNFVITTDGTTKTYAKMLIPLS
ncbi:MAG TPA: ATP-binding protein [Spirochaetota bacterium]|nr:ATP-binding protein [Spirochaetota bacterium]